MPKPDRRYLWVVELFDPKSSCWGSSAYVYRSECHARRAAAACASRFIYHTATRVRRYIPGGNS